MNTITGLVTIAGILVLGSIATALFNLLPLTIALGFGAVVFAIYALIEK